MTGAGKKGPHHLNVDLSATAASPNADSLSPDGSMSIEHIAGVEDFQIAQATYRAAVGRWPGGVITLRQGGRVIEDSRRTRFASWGDKGRQGGR
jgi:hypothetical protein